MLSSGDWDSKRTSSPTSTIAGRLLVGPRAAVVLSGDWCGARTAIAAKNAIEEVAAVARGGEASLGWRAPDSFGSVSAKQSCGSQPVAAFLLPVRNREIARRRQEGQQNEQLEQLAQGRSLQTTNRRTSQAQRLCEKSVSSVIFTNSNLSPLNFDPLESPVLQRTWRFLIGLLKRRPVPGHVVFRSQLDPKLHDYQTVEYKSTVPAGKRVDLLQEVVRHQGRNAKQNNETLQVGDVER